MFLLNESGLFYNNKDVFDFSEDELLAVSDMAKEPNNDASFFKFKERLSMSDIVFDTVYVKGNGSVTDYVKLIPHLSDNMYERCKNWIAEITGREVDEYQQQSSVSFGKILIYLWVSNNSGNCHNIRIYKVHERAV